MKELVILTPAVMNEECIKFSQDSLVENLIRCNPETNFIHAIHLDNHLRPGATGTTESIKKIYTETQRNNKNYRVDMAISPHRVGLVVAGHALFHAFLSSRVEKCLVFEDDTTLKRQISLTDFDSLFEQNINMIHLSFGVTTEKSGYSAEGHIDESLQELKSSTVHNIAVHDRTLQNKSSYSWNGTFLSRDVVKRFLPSYRLINHEKYWPEDQIGRFFHSSNSEEKVRTVFWKEEFDSSVDSNWETPRFPPNSHFIFDEIRYQRGSSKHGALI